MDAQELLVALTGRDRLSPSSLTSWDGDKAGWVAGYVFGLWEAKSPGMTRGKAVEAGVEALLHGTTLEEAKDRALHLWVLEAEREGLDTTTDDFVLEAASIAPMIEQAAAAIKARALPRPIATQLKCETWIEGPGWTIPLVGYADFCFEGWALDCKTTHSCPSSPKPLHVAQVACYAKARGDEHAGLLYLTPKKWALLPVDTDEIDAAWRHLRLIARSLLRALHRARTPEDLAADFPPPLDDFRWTPERRASLGQQIEAWAA